MSRDLSPAMIAILRNRNVGREWHEGFNGRSQLGGAERSLYALKRRGLIDNVHRANLTEAGRAALAEATS